MAQRETGVLEAPPDVDTLIEEIREAAREGDEAALRAARALELIERSKSAREMGHALLGDLVTRLGLSPRRARELLDLGRSLRCHPGL
ncbi:MAG: hypothetical protein HY720_10990 [Planctomycetes bacterium]|nr:hypothetical protein [Planctomycetota bacterium]